MRSKTQIPTAVFFAFLLVASAAQAQITEQLEKQPLIGKANPALSGIDKVYVIVEPADQYPSKDGLVWKDLQDSVEQELKKAGLMVEPSIVLGKGTREHNIAELRVYMEMLKFAETDIYVFRIQTALATMAQLPEQNLFFKAEVWQSASSMQAVPITTMPDAVKTTILLQTKAFLAAWLAANPSSAKAADILPEETSATTESVKTSQPQSPAQTEYKYIASRKSRVFHKADCAIAKRIKPENLIGYNTRDEAVKDGKRPCRRCNP
jgi:hypothetical protein